jgi:hypothetical protein
MTAHDLDLSFDQSNATKQAGFRQCSIFCEIVQGKFLRQNTLVRCKPGPVLATQ